MTWVVAPLLLLLVCSACAAPTGGPRGGPPADQPPYIEGVVTGVTPATDGGVVTVEDAAGGNQAAVTVTADSVIVQELGGGYEPASFAHLRPGLAVGVWITGPVRESFPVQVDAAGIVIRQ